MMLLSEIFKGAPAIDIKTLAIDSRKDMTDGIFFCIKGFRTDGHRFIKDAIHNGAKAIVYHDEIETSEKAVYIKVDDVIKVMNQVIKKFYNDPSEKMEMYAVTGTNGKTTIATLIKELIDIDEPCGYIGTLGMDYAGVKIDADLTTPTAIELGSHLEDMVQKGVKVLLVRAADHQGLGLQREGDVHVGAGQHLHRRGAGLQVLAAVGRGVLGGGGQKVPLVPRPEDHLRRHGGGAVHGDGDGGQRPLGVVHIHVFPNEDGDADGHSQRRRADQQLADHLDLAVQNARPPFPFRYCYHYIRTARKNPDAAPRRCQAPGKRL